MLVNDSFPNTTISKGVMLVTPTLTRVRFKTLAGLLPKAIKRNYITYGISNHNEQMLSEYGCIGKFVFTRGRTLAEP